MEEKEKTYPRSQKEGLNREGVETLRWFQTGCLSSAIPRHIMLRCLRNPYLVSVGSSCESGNPARIRARAPLGRNDDGPANPQPGPGSSVPGHVVGSLTRLTRNSASLSVACW